MLPELQPQISKFCRTNLCAAIVFLLATPALAQVTLELPANQNQKKRQEGPPDPLDFFSHFYGDRFWISGQWNVIFQSHSGFHARYSGTHSLKPGYEKATSSVATLYTGLLVSNNTALLFDLESAGGAGISNAFGLAGFSNLDVVRNPSLGPKPYVARAMIHQMIPLSGTTKENPARGPLSIFPTLPVRRLEFRAGKIGVADHFDNNSVGSDSHLQFMNWTVDNNGAYDYPADTRGYTLGAMVEYQDKSWGWRFGEFLMPAVANGIDYDFQFRYARSEDAEVELHGDALGKPGVVRFLSYLNHARMGNYEASIAAFLAGRDPAPIIENSRKRGRKKYGFGWNGEQQVGENLRIFGRAGWNDGRNESFAYTEVDRAMEVGADWRFTSAGRPQDKMGLAYSLNAISRSHREYLAKGGNGFLLGDGALSYGTENIIETYYNAHVWRGLFLALNIQIVAHPGYNRARGPVVIPGLRLHVNM
ncbi:MAG TPA: carbohydrate porin [Acidobacteriota bacterium]|jgi:hypothetical protein|nr:carbohydrate porin [Acidobacteriota bacterium]